MIIILVMQNLPAKESLAKIANARGAGAFGVCRIESLRDNFHSEIQDISRSLPYGISVGVPLSAPVLETIVDRPNMIYKAHYRQVNAILDDIAFALCSEIIRLGYRALPIPASMVLKRHPMIAHLSHREIAFNAGLGWRGRNNLLVNKDYGAQIRLVSLLTNLELPLDSPSTDNCGDCYDCLPCCPTGAIHEEVESFNLDACSQQVMKFARENDYGHYICGLCLKPCRGKIPNLQ
ncbi:MAG: epoxyqueuosine reductase [bacterium]